MDILNEIIEASNHMIDVLEETDFFIETPFVDKIPLKKALQIAMQRKWEQEDNMFLTDEEFLNVCKEVSVNGIGKTIGDLVDKGALNMSVNNEGEILYSANKDYKWDEDDTEKTNW